MKHWKMPKRFLATVLSLVMLLGTLPVIPLSVTATSALDSELDYVSLPITIRDFAADGMLFEYNEIGDTGTFNGGGAGVAPFANYSVVGAVDTVTLTGTTYGATITVTRTAKFDKNKEGGRYLKGTLNAPASSMRYLAFSYSQSSVDPYECPWLDFYSGTTKVKSIALTQGCNGTVHKLVLDLGEIGGNITEVRYSSHSSTGVVAKIYWMNGFATRAEAETFSNSGGAYSKVFNLNNTAGFGLLATTLASKNNNMYLNLGDGNQMVDKSGIAGSTFYRNGKWGVTYPSVMDVVLSNGAKQQLYGGVIRTDLIESYLVNGKPVYTQGTVDYLADYLSLHLQEAWKNSDNTYNMWYTMGQKLYDLGGTDLASKLRQQIKDNGNAMGTYADAKAAFEAGELEAYSDVNTYYEAAYFLLHNTYTDKVGYGKTVDSYKEIHLVEKTGADGKPYYVFNSGYNGVVYDTENGVIYNSQTETASYHKGLASNATAIRGNAWYSNRFDPLNPKYVGDKGYGMSGDTYRNAARKPDPEETFYYDDTNYNLSLEGHAQFVYHYEEGLYFTFTGDDDVYLFINGVRVLDLGGAHAISKATVNLNDVAALCGLVEGESFTFDFFYMERHGTAANFCIETNIKIVDPAMVTTKGAYQDGVAVGYNGYVRDGSNDRVIYEFGLENRGDYLLHDLTFKDSTIGVYVGADGIDLSGNRWTEISDLVATLYAKDGNKTVYSDMTEDELITILETGIDVGEKITIYGFGYNVPDNLWSDNSFLNRVETTANAHVSNTTHHTLTGMADWMVQKYDIHFDMLHVYDGGKLDKNGLLIPETVKGVTLTKDELLKVIDTATDSEGNPLDQPAVPNLSVNVNNISSAVLFTAAGYGSSEKVLQMTDPSHKHLIGSFNLADYTAIEFTYGSDPGAMLGSYGSEFVLTDASGNVLGRHTLSNPKGFWKNGSRTVNVAVDSNYNGPVYLTMNMKPDSTGLLHGTAVNKIKLIGRAATDIQLTANAKVVLSTASGLTSGAGINQNATVNANGGISYTSTKTGTDTIYYVIKDGSATYGPIAVAVYTYGVADSVFVLDYGLSVDLKGDGYSFTANDVLDLGSYNPYGTVMTESAIFDATENYGIFNGTEENVYYTMHSIMNGRDSFKVTHTVLETGKTEVNQYNGVELTQEVIVVPANVMYYEDDFCALDYNVTYVKNDFTEGVGNVWAFYNGDYVGTQQSPDQGLNYGYDPHYAVLGSEVLFFDPYYIEDAALSSQVQANLDRILNGSVEDWNSENPDVPYPAGELLGDASNDTIHVMNVAHPTNSEIFSFEFTGDGFEIVSRTTYASYAVLTVKIEQRQEDGSYKTYKLIPVISESLGGDLTQIPLIARKDLPYGDYRVSVYTSNVRGEDRVVYIDGVRVFNPLTAEESALYYKADEANVTFDEIKTCIKDKNIVYGTISPSILTEDVVEYITQWAYGSTMIECQDGSFVLSGTDPYDETMTEYEQFMTYGPNNEIYLNTSNGARMSYIAFYVEEDPTYVGERSIQVGAHLKYTGDNLGVGDEFMDYSAVSMVYGGAAFDILDADSTYMYAVSSGTEQYFSIDTDCLTFQNANGVRKALVIIGTNDPNQNTLTLTNLKLNGYSIASGTGDEVEAIQDASDVLASKLVSETYNLYEHYVLTSYRLNKKN